MGKLETLRSEIDQADAELLDALARRMGLIEQLFHEKERRGLEIFSPERERLVIGRIVEKAEKLRLDIKFVERLLREIISHSRRVQNDRRMEYRGAEAARVKVVSYQGSPGAYSWMASRRHFKNLESCVGCETFSEALERLARGEVDRAVLPVHNSIAGSIHEVYQLLQNDCFYVVGEESLIIEHCLIGLEGASISEISRIYSHPVALRQCVRFLKALEGVECLSFTDTADAVLKVKTDGLPHQAAIASESAAKLHGLEVIKPGISDYPDNRTLFWVIADKQIFPDASVAAKTSLILVTKHEEGALVKCLQVFADHRINMLKLESRARRQDPSEYKFYIDLEGNVRDERMTNALEELRRRSLEVLLLGCYPRDMSFR
jgi:chorismate mutase/prephenate dehydratase